MLCHLDVDMQGVSSFLTCLGPAPGAKGATLAARISSVNKQAGTTLYENTSGSTGARFVSSI